MLALILFWLFFGVSLLQTKQRQSLSTKSYQDWLLDSISLGVQGALIPLLQIILGLQLYQVFFPQFKGYLEIEPFLGFIISFIAVDYLYYWNHRLLHCKLLFPIHAVHHTVTRMDMLGTSRNTLWASFFLPYIWVNSVMLYLLDDVRGYAFGIFLTCLLDLWRHSSLDLPQQSLLYRVFNSWLILPKDHRCHHHRNEIVNFSANLKIWDCLHGTYLQSDSNMNELGSPLEMNLMQKLLFPFSFQCQVKLTKFNKPPKIQ